MTTKKTALKKAKKAAAVTQPPLYHRLDALVHTIRCIAQYEDALCELSHDVKRAGTASSQMTHEVRSLLEKIPSHDFLLDLDAVRNLLGDPVIKKPIMAKKSGKSTGRK